MQNLKFDDIKVTELTSDEMVDTNGGFLSAETLILIAAITGIMGASAAIFRGISGLFRALGVF